MHWRYGGTDVSILREFWNFSTQMDTSLYTNETPVPMSYRVDSSCVWRYSVAFSWFMHSVRRISRHLQRNTRHVYNAPHGQNRNLWRKNNVYTCVTLERIFYAKIFQNVPLLMEINIFLWIKKGDSILLPVTSGVIAEAISARLLLINCSCARLKWMIVFLNDL